MNKRTKEKKKTEKKRQKREVKKRESWGSIEGQMRKEIVREEGKKWGDKLRERHICKRNDLYEGAKRKG